ncbi:MAG: 3-methylitaconate isomerase [Nitrospinae bacterium]|nr:3-methylitaconate isomerase [Nitrospinota bacterium]
MQIKIPAAFMRGGTSRAVFFTEEALVPFDPRTRELIILAAMGSPDPYGRQIDGLGGGISSLSKVAIIGRGNDPETDVRFTFGQVDVERPFVDFLGTCGNISAAVGPFAIDERLVRPVEPVTAVRVLATNTGKRYIAHVPVCDGQAEMEGDYVIDGVPGPAGRIALEFLDPGGSLGGRVLPSGHGSDTLVLEQGRRVAVSIVDAAIPMVFVRADELGASATESPQLLDADRPLQELLEEIRCRAAVQLGLADSALQAREKVKALPKIAMVAPPAQYRTTRDTLIAPEHVDLVARMISMGKTHRTFAGTSSMCTAIAAAIPGSVVHTVARQAAPDRVRIGHPAGIMEVGAKVQQRGDDWYVESVTTQRTARRIMDGVIYVPQRYIQGKPWFVE